MLEAKYKGRAIKNADAVKERSLQAGADKAELRRPYYPVVYAEKNNRSCKAHGFSLRAL